MYMCVCVHAYSCSLILYYYLLVAFQLLNTFWVDRIDTDYDDVDLLDMI